MSVTDVVRVSVPLVPVIVSANVPVAVVAVVPTVNVDDVPVAGFGLNVPLAPAGNPLTVNVTAPVKPPLLVMFAV
jgi:hypothetical protein